VVTNFYPTPHPLLNHAPGGKTEHYTTGVQYELKTSLQVRPPPPVATGTSPRAPRNHTTGGYIAEIPYKPQGGYISPYKPPTRLDELGKLSREIPAPWDYAEAQVGVCMMLCFNAYLAIQHWRNTITLNQFSQNTLTLERLSVRPSRWKLARCLFVSRSKRLKGKK
jgi:hypothetical protein